MLRALLLEMSYRTLPSLPAGAPYVAPPDWLVEGILTLDNETPEVFEGLDSSASHPPTLKSLVTQNAGLLDSQSHAFYGACASALVRLLLGHENGHTQLTRYIADLPRASSDALLDLQAHFPWLGKEAEVMERFWTENIARLAQERRFVLMTFAATSEQLDDCLRTKVAQGREKKDPLTLDQTVRANRPNIDSKTANELAQYRPVLLDADGRPLPCGAAQAGHGDAADRRSDRRGNRPEARPGQPSGWQRCITREDRCPYERGRRLYELV